MQISDIYKEFTVKDGIIQNQGKFEGCPYFVPYFWNSFLNGEYDELNGEYIIFNIFNDDKVMFPYKKELYNNYNIDCGTDYAKFILDEIVYNEHGESII